MFGLFGAVTDALGELVGNENAKAIGDLAETGLNVAALAQMLSGSPDVLAALNAAVSDD